MVAPELSCCSSSDLDDQSFLLITFMDVSIYINLYLDRGALVNYYGQVLLTHNVPGQFSH